MDPIELRLKNAAKRGHQGRLRPEVRADRPRRDAGGRQDARALAHAAREEPGPRRRLAASGSTSAARPRCRCRINEDGTAVADGRHARHRRPARLAVHDGGRGARRAARQDAARDRSATPARSATTSSPAAAAPPSPAAWRSVEAAREGHGRGLQARRQADLGACPRTRSSTKDGAVRPAGANAGKFKPMTLAEIAGIAGKTGGPIARLCAHQRARRRRRASPPTSRRRGRPRDRQGRRSCATRPSRMPARAIHPSYVEGQFQGGAVQGIGWALNEEYIYGDDGKLQNAGFLDYRMPVASDLPMIDTVIVEVPNPRHPYGVRGVGETPIVPPMAAIANAIAQRHRHPLHRAADVAAQGAGGAGRAEVGAAANPPPRPSPTGRGERGPPGGGGVRDAYDTMPKIFITGSSLRQFTGGVSEFEVTATNFHRLCASSTSGFPASAIRSRRAWPSPSTGRSIRTPMAPRSARTARSISSPRSAAASRPPPPLPLRLHRPAPGAHTASRDAGCDHVGRQPPAGSRTGRQAAPLGGAVSNSSRTRATVPGCSAAMCLTRTIPRCWAARST